MRKARGIIALTVAIVLGLIAAWAVMAVMNKPKKKASPRKVAAKPVPAPKYDIPAGKRVVTLRVKETLSGPDPIKPGDRVDIVATSPLEGKTGHLSRVIMENVPVHYVSRDKDGGKRLVAQAQQQAVAFLLDPDQAVSLVGAASGAQITLLPRGRKDRDSGSDDGDGHRHRFLYTPEEGVQVLPASGRALAREIPAGMRAVTLRLSDTDGLCGRLVPGDRVDVILTSLVAFVQAGEDRRAGATAKLSKFEYSSRTMMENIAVIGTETTFETGATPTEPVRLVTVLVSPQQALKLSAASDAAKKARIRLVARHPDDTSPVATRKEALKNLLSESREYRRVPVMRGMTVTETPFYQ